jgi:tetratricopeptide (TPR) repeat protein
MTRPCQKILPVLIGFVLLFVMASCYGNPPGGGPQQSPVVGMALEAPKDFPNKEAAAKNNEGVDHLKQEHWDISANFFRDAIALSSNLAEAHFNLGLVLDQMGNHQEAAQQFKTAKELAPNNPKIAENEILKKHL